MCVCQDKLLVGPWQHAASSEGKIFTCARLTTSIGWHIRGAVREKGSLDEEADLRVGTTESPTARTNKLGWKIGDDLIESACIAQQEEFNGDVKYKGKLNVSHLA